MQTVSMHSDGYWLDSDCFSDEQIQDINTAIDNALNDQHCVRNVFLKYPDLITKCVPALRQKVGEEYFCVKAILFQKHPQHNWRVPWHQDLTIQLKAQYAHKSFGPWSVKEHIHCAQAPASLLNQMITTRIHLHDCKIDDGALYVKSGSHCNGITSFKGLDDQNTDNATLITAQSGDVLFMSPLLQHASLDNTGNGSRRILHLEWSQNILPHPLSFNEQY